MPIEFHLPVIDVSLKKKGKQSWPEEIQFVVDNRHPERSPGAVVREFGISNLKSTCPQSRDSSVEVGDGLGLDCAKCLVLLGGFKIAAGGQKKTFGDAAICINHKPLKRDVMTDTHATQSRLRLWLIFVLFYLLWCISFLFFSKASETVQTWSCHPTPYAHGVTLLQCACLAQHRVRGPSVWKGWNIQTWMHFSSNAAVC